MKAIDLHLQMLAGSLRGAAPEEIEGFWNHEFTRLRTPASAGNFPPCHADRFGTMPGMGRTGRRATPGNDRFSVRT